MSNGPTDRIVAFIAEVGIPILERDLSVATFLPGILIERGVIVFDRAKLLSPGDLLHEAGHLAMAMPAERPLFQETFGTDGGMEMAAIAWSYAAAHHLGVPLDTLFHDAGYRGDASWLREHFSTLRSLGVPMLVWRGMTTTRTYPQMQRWVTVDDHEMAT